MNTATNNAPHNAGPQNDAAPDIRFYSLTLRSLHSALPEILAKALAGGRRIVIRMADDAALAPLSDALWTAQPDSFLPHGYGADKHAADQPIWLTARDENPNGADMLVLAGGAVIDDPAGWGLCCVIMEGHDDNQLATGRALWKSWKERGYNGTYWQQTMQGWEKKA